MLSDKESLKREKINEWEQGLRPDKSIIGHYRDQEYREYKYSQNPRAKGNVDLLLTRGTANSLFVQSEGKREFIFGMNDKYNLVGNYGYDILGLNQDWFNIRQNELYRITLVYQIKKNYKIG